MTKFKLVHQCIGHTAKLAGVNLLAMKGVTASFEGVCTNCGVYVRTDRRAGVGVMRTATTDPRLRYHWSRDRRFWIAVPYSLMHWGKGSFTELKLGNVVLKLHHDVRTFSGAVPDSWLVDLAVDVPDQIETL
jgi:hypothetical protein